MRRALIAATFLLSVSPALAEQASPGPGRYQIAPSEGGFTRLDTRTGATSHCVKRDGVWACEPLGAADDDLQGQLADLTGTVAGLGASVAALNARLDALSARLDAIATAGLTPAAPAADEGRRSDEQAMNFAERIMRRFFDMVREMKDAEANRI